MNHSACSLMVPGSWKLPHWELCDFSMGMGSCYILHAFRVPCVMHFSCIFACQCSTAEIWKLRIYSPLTQRKPCSPLSINGKWGLLSVNGLYSTSIIKTRGIEVKMILITLFWSWHPLGVFFIALPRKLRLYVSNDTNIIWTDTTV